MTFDISGTFKEADPIMTKAIPTRRPQADAPNETERVRYGTYVLPETAELIRRAAYYLRLTTGEVVDEAIREFVAREEKRSGEAFGPIDRLKRGRRIR